MAEPLLLVQGIEKSFHVRDAAGRPRTVAAVQGVDLAIGEHETLGLVGESGSGKSTLARLILRLIRADRGAVRFEGADLLALGREALRGARSRLQLVFQDPYASLNPALSVADNVAFSLWAHGVRRRQAEPRAMEALTAVGLSARQAHRRPRELSGGQRQRVNIARALVLRPRLVVLDEPVSALDKSIQAQVLNLLQDLREEYGLSYLFISHDLDVVEYMSDRVAVMYGGRLVETAPAAALYARPLHPYTRMLLDSAPRLGAGRTAAERPVAAAEGPSPHEVVAGCAFRFRCTLAIPRCEGERPALTAAGPDHGVACHRTEGGAGAA